jgi:hypothetical protein
MQLAFDYDLWWRLYRTYGKPAYCKEFVAVTRMHKDTKTANHPALHYQESMRAVERHWGSVPLKWRAALPLMQILQRKKAGQTASSPGKQKK